MTGIQARTATGRLARQVEVDSLDREDPFRVETGPGEW